MTVQRRIQAAMALLLGTLVLVAGVLAWNTYWLSDQSKWVGHTLDVERELGEIYTALDDVEAGLRGYSISEAPVFAEPLLGRSNDARAHLAQAIALTADNPEQQGRLAELTPLVNERLAILLRAAERIRTNTRRASPTHEGLLRGKKAMDDIRARIAAMKAVEEQLLAVREASARQAARRALILGSLLAVLLAVAAVVIFHRGRAELLARIAAEDALRISEETLQLTIDSMKDYAVSRVDLDGTIVSWSAGAANVYGYAPDEIIGRRFTRLLLAEEIAEGRSKGLLEQALREGAFEEEGQRVRKDGSHFWAQVSVRVLRRPDGSIRGLVNVTRDITARRHAEDERARLLEQVQRSNRELQEFAFVASHDLQEPLRKIRMFGDRLREEYGAALEQTGVDYLSRMQSAAARGQSLIQGLLAFSRVTTQAKPEERIALDTVLREVVSDLEGSLTLSRGRVELAALPAVQADGLQMRQLFQNLLGNALKFHRPGEVPVVRVSATAEGGFARFEVCDNGIGFDEKYLDRLFKLFQRLHDRQSYEGTGLGLAICRKIVERHGGSITARSQPGSGATFCFTLPLAREPVAPSMERAA